MTEAEKQAMKIIEQYGWIDGDHHKKWVLDQVARILLGDQYRDWRDKQGEDYDEGIAP